MIDEPIPTETAAPLAELTSEQALRRIVWACAAEIDRHMAVFLGSEDEAGPHKARVALRRLTTALDAFGPILRRTPKAEIRAEAKRIFRALGEVRDADVYLAGKGARQGGRNLARETALLRARVRARLRARKAVTFAPRLVRLFDDDGLLREKPRGVVARAAPVIELARAALDNAWDRAGAWGDDPAVLGEESLHDFRKDMKTLRYLSEFFAPLWPDASWPDFRNILQGLQDDLGLLNDMANARAKTRDKTARSPREIEALTASTRDWRALLAMGPFWS